MKINAREKKNNIKVNGKNPHFFLVVSIFLCFLSFLAGGVLYHHGVHTNLKLIVQGRFTEMPDGPIKEAFEEMIGLVKSETTAYKGNNLPTLYLDIPFENMQLIQQKRYEALDTGILLASDEDYVTAVVRYNDSSPIDIELRLKGDWTDHLEGNKWSYRIHIKDDAAIEGMRRFSIQAPETRNFVYEWAYHQTLMREGLLAPRYFFVNVVENGENKGIYAMEESFYTELVESQERRAGVIVRFNEEDMWQNWANFFSNGKEDSRTIAGSSGYFMQADYEAASISGFGLGKIVVDPVLLAEYKAAQTLLRNYQSGVMSASEVFDMQQMGKFIAITELWGAGHSLAWHNLRFYYNPVTNLLEPIAFDGIPMVEPYLSKTISESSQENFIFRDPEIRGSFLQEYEEYFSTEYIAELEKDFQVQIGQFDFAIRSEYATPVVIDWEQLSTRGLLCINELKFNSEVVNGTFTIAKNTPSLGTLQLTNRYLIDLLITDSYLISDEEQIPIDFENDKIFACNYSNCNPQQWNIELPSSIEIKLEGVEGIKIKVANSLNGNVGFWLLLPAQFTE